jgi:hypothetical protein
MRRLTREVLVNAIVCPHGFQASTCPYCELSLAEGKLRAAERELDLERERRRLVAHDIEATANVPGLGQHRVAVPRETLERWADALTEGD